MPIFRRRRKAAPADDAPEAAGSPPPITPGPPPEDLVRLYLRGQNLEQIGRHDEAAGYYEQAVSAGFDAAGPYDRLIYIYRARDAHTDVVRVVDAALARVRTFDEKRDWYTQMRQEAIEGAKQPSDPTGPEF